MENQNLRVPAWCPNCEIVMKGKSTDSYYNWGVCVGCFIEFIEGREERWRSGWRPSPEEMSRYQDSFGIS